MYVECHLLEWRVKRLSAGLVFLWKFGRIDISLPGLGIDEVRWGEKRAFVVRFEEID